MKMVSSVSFVLFLLWVLLALLDMWFGVIGAETFVKITITMLVVVCLLRVMNFSKRDDGNGP